MKAVLNLKPIVVKVSLSKSIILNNTKKNDAQYKISLAATDVDWDLDWVKIVPNHSMLNIRIKPVKLSVHTGFGAVYCTPVINYDRSFFRLKDKENLLSTDNAFEYLIFEYDLEADLENRINIDFIENYQFGHNVILEESYGEYDHAYNGRSTFEALYPNFKGEFHTTLDDEFKYKGAINDLQEGRILNEYGANLILRPYGNRAGDLAIVENTYQNPEILKIISHSDNTYKRVDVTDSPDKFLLNTVCVGSITDEDNFENHGDSTSYGFGLEFYENTSTAIWDDLFPDKSFKTKVFNGTLNEKKNEVKKTSGLFSALRFAGIEVGAPLILKDRFGREHYTTIESLDNSKGLIFLNEPILNFPDSFCEVYTLVGLGSMWCPYTSFVGNCGSQSFAVNIIGAKFRMIQDRTGASWAVCRNAARKTASLSTYDENTAIWTTHWDMWRGFGIINVDRAVDYILQNKNRKEFKGSSVLNLPKTFSFLEFKDYGENNYFSIRYAKRLFDYLREKMGLIDRNILKSLNFKETADARVSILNEFYNYSEIYEVKGNGGFQAILLRHSTAAKQGDKLTVSGFIRVLSNDSNNIANLRIANSDGSEQRASTTKVNEWEKIVLHYESNKEQTNQIQIVPAYNNQAVTQFCCISLEEGWVDDPQFVADIYSVLR